MDQRTAKPPEPAEPPENHIFFCKRRVNEIKEKLEELNTV